MVSLGSWNKKTCCFRTGLLRGFGFSEVKVSHWEEKWHFSNGKNRILTDRTKCKGGSFGNSELEDTKERHQNREYSFECMGRGSRGIETPWFQGPGKGGVQEYNQGTFVASSKIPGTFGWDLNLESGSLHPYTYSTLFSLILSSFPCTLPSNVRNTKALTWKSIYFVGTHLILTFL